MNARSILVAALALCLAAGAFLFHRDYEYRKVNGTVTQVSLTTWEQEVEKARTTRPVLIYFYRENDKTPANEAQNKAVADFAWSTAGKVKVVAVNVGHFENLPLAIAHGSFRQPGFVLISGDDFVSGPSGVVSTKEDLMRLLESLPQSQPQKP